MSVEKIIQILLGVLTTISVALAAFALKWVFDANAQMKVVQKTMELRFADFEKTHEGLADDTDEMTRLTRQLSKHWKLHTWAKDQVAELRHKNQMKPVSWPNLE